MGLPPESERISSFHEILASNLSRRLASQSPVYAMRVVVLLELAQLPLEVPGIPE
jgi:hypothetical protein